MPMAIKLEGGGEEILFRLLKKCLRIRDRKQLRKDTFSSIRAQHVLSCHLIKVPWLEGRSFPRYLGSGLGFWVEPRKVSRICLNPVRI